ncbi:MAG: rod shape-determining protein MreC [Frankiaceae bacterium]|nr:rod shape-determining protein MreC [Frankiaceae bacterium]
MLALLLLTSFTLITLDYRSGSGSPLSPLRGVVSAVVGPIERAAAAIVRPVRGALDDIGNLGSSKKKIASLQEENARLRAQNNQADLYAARLREIAKVNHLSGVGQYRIVKAQVVALGDALGFEYTATIDAGTKDGIKPGLTVINGDGLVGRVKSVGRDTATVLLAIDPISTVYVRLEGSLRVGALTGQGQGELDFQLRDANAKVKKGERLVTFGSQGKGPFVAEVPVGTVSAVESTPGALTRSAKVKPFVDFGALDIVAVVLESPRTIPRDSVLPPKPTPSPTPSQPAPNPSVPANPSGTPTPSATPTRRP